MTIYQFDYIVIGSGIAGLRAAFELAEAESKVILITKGEINDTATDLAQGGIAVALHQEDTPAMHFDDTLMAGDGLCDETAVKALVEDGPQQVESLIAMGARFDQTDGAYHFTREAAHSRRRILHAGDWTGHEIGRTLARHVLGHRNIQIHQTTSVSRLLVENNHCVGCIGIYLPEQQPATYLARATILATGGLAYCFSHATTPPVLSGDGIALAYEAGAVLQDMELIQFHPTTFSRGEGHAISHYVITEAIRGEGAHLINCDGKRFMYDYHPLAELAPRDIVARSIVSEIEKTQAETVFLDLRHLEFDIPARFPNVASMCRKHGIDIRTDLIPVTPAAHYFMGGISTNLDGESSITGLYAAGECASLGIHGANRLASNSLLDGLVFGYRAARHALAHAPQLPDITLDLEDYKSDVVPPIKTIRFSQTIPAIRKLLWQNIGIRRNAGQLTYCLNELNALNWILQINTLDPDIRRFQHLITLGKLMAEFALARKESRGCHYRTDYPEKNPAYRRHFKKRIGDSTLCNFEEC